MCTVKTRVNARAVVKESLSSLQSVRIYSTYLAFINAV